MSTMIINAFYKHYRILKWIAWICLILGEVFILVGANTLWEDWVPNLSKSCNVIALDEYKNINKKKFKRSILSFIFFF